MDPRKTRGYLNNNPTNLDRSPANNWQGEIKDAADPRLTDFQKRELTSGRFAVFQSAEWGIRAAVKNLQSYHRSGFNTPGKAIGRWAPPNENDTAAYLARVEKITGLSPNAPFDPNDYGQMSALVRAIITVELGGQPYPAKVIEDGLRLAGIVKPVGMATSNTVRGGAVSVSGTSLSLIADQVQDAAYTIAPIADSGWGAKLFLALKIIGVVLAVAGVAYMLYERYGRKRRDERIEAVE